MRGNPGKLGLKGLGAGISAAWLGSLEDLLRFAGKGEAAVLLASKNAKHG